jgi:sulfite reductase (ferredoxin)
MATTDENVKLNPVEEARSRAATCGTIGEELPTARPFRQRKRALLKTHGTYQQDDRDARAAAHAPAAAARRRSRSSSWCTRIPGGKMTSEQMLAERHCDELGNATLRITTRQGLQHHGIPKTTLKECIRRINDIKLTTLAACAT